ncbi:MAG: hypothetical protein NTX50_16830 [Candidatus Sumerlaeota bacterium]|nr:hypothetical protein [Candidatus Sumerlaeota bacterium]
MNKTTITPSAVSGGDVVLQEIWRIKDALSAARGHDVHRLFAEARERQEHSGHPVANFQKKPKHSTNRQDG